MNHPVSSGQHGFHRKKDKIVAVYTNLSEKGVRLNEIHKEWVSEISSITTYTTTNNKNLQEVHVTADQQVIVPRKVLQLSFII